MDALEKADNKYWAEQDLFTAWEAAFLFCEIEPWEEPFQSIALPPESVVQLRQQLIHDVPNNRDGSRIPAQGWSCRKKRPASTTGGIFRRDDLSLWAEKNRPLIPAFLLSDNNLSSQTPA